MTIRNVSLAFSLFLAALISVPAFALDEKLAAATVGDSAHQIKIGAMDRNYIVHVPEGLDTSKSIPLVLIFHGGGGTAQGMVGLCKFNALANHHKFIAVYPDSVHKHWNDGRVVRNTTNYDDTAFISALIDKMVRDYKVDPKRVYVTGISNGGFFSQRLALQMPEKIAAAAVVVAGITDDLKEFSSSKPIPIMFIVGTKDPLVPFDGGQIGGWMFGNRGKVLSANETMEFWAKHNQCLEKPTVTELPIRDQNDGTRIKQSVYKPTGQGQEVDFLTVEGGGHTWPSGKQYLPEAIVGKTTKQLSNEDIWAFFETKHL